VFTEDEQAGLLAGLGGGEPLEDAGPQVDKAEELLEKWQCQPGQIWQIESKTNPSHYHRLICGDCRDLETVKRLTEDKPVNGVFTSPPYAMQRAKQYGGVPTGEYVDWWEAVQDNVRAVLTEDGSFFVNIKPHCEDGQRVLYVFDLVLAMVRRWGWRYVDELCWKRRGYPGDYKIRFKNTFEPIFHFSKNSTIKFRPNNVLKEPELSTRNDKRNSTYKEHIKKGKKKTLTGSPFDSSVSMIPYNYDEGVRPTNMIEAHLVVNNIPQSAQFPVDLPAFLIKAYSDPLDLWLDPFCGSGTVLVACENEGRLGLGIEKLEKYCAVILERFLTTFEIEPELIT
jgi:site-specific DNA-methyltransferase (adenine-specific)/site-specific DNA-methyltransferase (cytosine-N4-specific)